MIESDNLHSMLLVGTIISIAMMLIVASFLIYKTLFTGGYGYYLQLEKEKFVDLKLRGDSWVEMLWDEENDPKLFRKVFYYFALCYPKRAAQEVFESLVLDDAKDRARVGKLNRVLTDFEVNPAARRVLQPFFVELNVLTSSSELIVRTLEEVIKRFHASEKYVPANHNTTAIHFKRLIDILLSFVLILLTSPIMIIVIAILLIRPDSPVFVVSKRLGHKGKIFHHISFPSTPFDARPLELHSVSEIPANFNSQIKGINRILVRFHVTQLPTLFNVLMGQMSLIGPMPAYVHEILTWNSHYRLARLNMKPGFSGVAQLASHIEQISPKDYEQLEIEYSESWTPRKDFKIFVFSLNYVVNSIWKGWIRRGLARIENQEFLHNS